MQGTILILDGVATNRILLKARLAAAHYRVVQANRLAGLGALVRRVQPDLVVTALDLPDGTAAEVCASLAQACPGRTPPVIALTAQDDPQARCAALQAGVDDVLSQPLNDLILPARIRSLLRGQGQAADLHLREGPSHALGFAEPALGFDGPATIALVNPDTATAVRWKKQLQPLLRHQLRVCPLPDAHRLMSQDPPQAIVLGLTAGARDPGLRRLSDLRAAAATRTAAIVAVPDPADPVLAADALDLGADDVMPGGFGAQELALRLRAQLRRKARSDRMRDRVRDGLQAALTDPMTGLFNRRYALSELNRMAQQAGDTAAPLAVMIADLDHFKQINDRFGHLSGDAVLIKVANLLRRAIGPDDLLARVGGEEFLIAMPKTDTNAAAAAAERLCRIIEATPVTVAGDRASLRVTVSIGVAVMPGGRSNRFDDLIGQADRALYSAKGAGRNQVTLCQAA